MRAPQRLALILLAFRATVSALNNSSEEKDGFVHFLREHFLPNFVSLEGVDCNYLMSGSFLTRGKCKEVNTYIVSFPDHLQAVCGSKGKPYKNLRRSQDYFDLITCTLEGDPEDNVCSYSQHRFSAAIAVACDRYGYPVHLEEGDFEGEMEMEDEVTPTWYNYIFSVFD